MDTPPQPILSSEECYHDGTNWTIADYNAVLDPHETALPMAPVAIAPAAAIDDADEAATMHNLIVCKILFIFAFFFQ